MSRTFLSEPDPTPDVTALYESDVADHGYVMNLSRVWGHHPPAQEALSAQLQAMTELAGLGFRDRGILVLGEAGWRRNQLPGDAGLPGNAKLGGYWATGQFDDLLDDDRRQPYVLSGRPPRVHHGNQGVYGLLDQMLYGVGAFDPLAWIVAALVLGACGLLACAWPLRRAASVPASEVLRS